jgi:hypothetical protein
LNGTTLQNFLPNHFGRYKQAPANDLMQSPLDG